MEKTELMEQEKMINGILTQTDEYVRHEYLSVLDQAVPRELEYAARRAVGSNMQLMHLKSFTYNSEDNIAQKICSVYGAIERSGNTAALILDGRNDSIALYLGIFTSTADDSSSNYKAFLNSFNGVFPGCEYQNVKENSGRKLIEDLFNAPVNTAIAAVSAFPFHEQNRKDKEAAGLEVLVDGMKNRPFTMILLAEAADRVELVQRRQGYESLYTQICPLQKREVSISNSQTDTNGISFSRSIADSLSVSSGISRSHTDTVGTSHSTQKHPDNEPVKQQQAVNQLAGSAIAAASVLTLGPGGIAVKEGASILQNLFFGQTLSNLLNNAETVMDTAPKAEGYSEVEGSHEDHSDTETIQENQTKGRTETVDKSISGSRGLTQGQTMQISYTNKSVVGLLERIEERIKELTRLENEGAYKFAAYFIAGDEETAVSAASLYRSIVTAGAYSQTSSPVYHWANKEKCGVILDALRSGSHPTFVFDEYPAFPYVSAAQPIGLSDLPYYLCFPRKSVYGLNVAEHAAFSRDILRRNNDSSDSSRTIQIGNIYHMGREVKSAPVLLDADMLTSHLFVAGATGVGKSNFCYHMLEQLIENGIKTLIIEPAKGEYAKVFGGREDFDVYGTNLRQAPPLRINPFAFPKGVSASEHIERLLAIFNAAWPMYSAMPAIMKDALEEIYRRHGFDDIWGDLPEGGTFPTFSDLLDVLPEIIRESKYSAEVQGNYIGALVTRVKSLTNGVYSVIFSDEEIGDAGLFDKNVIVDISRIGSEETKALIMGVLITRLGEYRSCSGRMNSVLNHITLLEEAHHLLGKQTGNQGPDFGNMRGASVEMLSNAIREMRTYGEGFVIADQSPSVMDSSVIANTQTKVFFMMPRREDRLIASDTMSLDEKQADEIAKLPKGVAAVLQNEWSAAVLCKIIYFSPDKQKAFTYNTLPEDETKQLLSEAVRILLNNKIFSEECGSREGLALAPADLLQKGFGLGARRKLVLEIIENRGKYTHLTAQAASEYLQKILDIDGIFRRSRTQQSVENWARNVEQSISKRGDFSEKETEKIIHTYLLSKAKVSSEYHKLYTAYLTYKKDNIFE